MEENVDNADAHDADNNPQRVAEKDEIQRVAEENDHNDGDNEHETEIQSVAEEDDHNDGDDEHETEVHTVTNDHNDGDNEHETKRKEATGGIDGLLPHLDSVFIPTSDQMVNPIGMQQELNRNPAPSTSSHQLPEDPFGQQRRLSTNPAPFIPQTTSHHLPVANQFPNLAPRQNQMMVPGPPFLVPNDAPWNPHNTSQQLPPYLVANMQNPYPPPMAYHHNLYYPAPMPFHHNLYYPAPMAFHHDPAPMAYYHHPPPRAYHRKPPPMAYRHTPPSVPYLQNPYPHPMANMMMPRFRSNQMLRMRPPREQQRPLAGVENYYYNPQQHFVLPDRNHQRLQQIQPRIQQPMRSQGFDAGASSNQGQDQQQPR